MAKKLSADDGKTTEHKANEATEFVDAALAEDAADLAAATLTGDLRDWLLDRIRNLQKPWAEMSEGEQRDLIYATEFECSGLVRQAVRLIAADNRPTIVAKVKAVAVGDDEYKATLTLAKTSQYRHELCDSQGLDVLIVVTDVEPYIGMRSEAKPDAKPDPQGDLLNDEPVFDRTPNGQQ